MTIVRCHECGTRHDGPKSLVAHMRTTHMHTTSTIECHGVTVTVYGLPWRYRPFEVWHRRRETMYQRKAARLERGRL